jgi:DNA repair photolyase
MRTPRLQHELRPGRPKRRAVYFSPSSDLFQPVPEVLELSHAVIEFLFSEGIGVAFLTKGEIPDKTLDLLIKHADLVEAQIGIITLDEEITRIFEPRSASPRTRLWQLHSLVAGGVAAAARLDPILPALTDAPDSLGQLFTALAQVGVKRAAAGVLFLRPGILYWLQRRVPRKVLAPLLAAYNQEEQSVMRGADYPIHNLPLNRRRDIFARVREAAAPFSIQIDICACKNPDIARGSCNIAGVWPSRTNGPVQNVLPSLLPR